MVTWAQTAVCTAVSPMSGSPTCDTEKQKTERGEFITPPRPTGGYSKKNPDSRSIWTCYWQNPDSSSENLVSKLEKTGLKTRVLVTIMDEKSANI